MFRLDRAKISDYVIGEFDTPNFLFIVMDLTEGGEMFEKIIEKTKLSEDEAKLHFFLFALAIKYLHLKRSVTGT